jgi:hypothetical protein
MPNRAVVYYVVDYVGPEDTKVRNSINFNQSGGVWAFTRTPFLDAKLPLESHPLIAYQGDGT